MHELSRDTVHLAGTCLTLEGVRVVTGTGSIALVANKWSSALNNSCAYLRTPVIGCDRNLPFTTICLSGAIR